MSGGILLSQIIDRVQTCRKNTVKTKDSCVNQQHYLQMYLIFPNKKDKSGVSNEVSPLQPTIIIEITFDNTSDVEYNDHEKPRIWWSTYAKNILTKNAKYITSHKKFIKMIGKNHVFLDRQQPHVAISDYVPMYIVLMNDQNEMFYELEDPEVYKTPVAVKEVEIETEYLHDKIKSPGTPSPTPQRKIAWSEEKQEPKQEFKFGMGTCRLGKILENASGNRTIMDYDNNKEIDCNAPLDNICSRGGRHEKKHDSTQYTTQYITYNKRTYKVRTDQHGNKFIRQQQTNVYLKDIRGKYRYKR
jgi:hypothetical protein